MMKDAEDLSADEFVRMVEGGRPMRSSDYVSISELAVESGRSVRTLRRWNKLPGDPKRYRRGRRLMYRRTDVQHWHSEGSPHAGDETPEDCSI
jgi:hypothetical protein